MLELKDRVGVVSGGASGIGAACVRELATAGVTAVSWDLSPDADVHCDTSDEGSVRAALDETVERFGVPSLHVAAAGKSGFAGPIVDIPVEEWDSLFAVNTRGVFLTTRTIAKRMIAEGLDGSIVTLGSVQGVIPDPALAIYSAAKAAVFQFTRVAAIELGPHGIRVNGIGPGPTMTPMIAALADSPEWRATTEAVTPLRRVGTAEDVAEVIVNVMRSSWLTGQCILTDGGSSLMSARGALRAKVLESS